MFRYTVTYNEVGDRDALLQSASAAYELTPFFKVEFPDKLEFIQLMDAQWSGLPTLCAYEGSTFCAGLLISPPSPDIHIRGTGRYVLHSTVLPGYTGLLPLLLNKLRHMIIAEGGSWYHINKQTGHRTNQGRYRRIT